MRRAHVEKLNAGRVVLDASESRHLRTVLRLDLDAEIELFDDVGNVGIGQIVETEPMVIVEIKDFQPASAPARKITVASAVPKGERADWLVEKLSELGCARWIPLRADRSVALPTGEAKQRRWQRIAVEAAKQSRRAGVMEIDELTRLETAIANCAPADSWVLATEIQAAPLAQLLKASIPLEVSLFVGPEGGWTPTELDAFRSAGVVPAKLTPTILRIETACIAAATIAMVS